VRLRRAIAIAFVVFWWTRGPVGRPAFARGGAATDAYDDIAASAPLDLHALADVYVIHNFDSPASGINQLRAFDFRDRPSLGYLRLTFAARPRPVGFRLDLGAGNTADVFEQQDPARARHPDWARATSFVGQALVTVVVPLALPIAVDAGKFATPVGMEDNETITNWNYSRSLLYAWAEPTLHTGLRSTCRLTARLAVSLFWVNGWNAGLVDGSGMRTFAGAATWKPSDGIEVAVVDMAGLEHPPTLLTVPLSFRNLFDAYAVLEPWRGVSFALSADVGNDRAGGGVGWWGAAGYARLQTERWFAATLRGEWFSDPDGFTTGTRQAVSEVTTTVEARGAAGPVRLVGRLEYRHDRSNAAVFDAARPASRERQDTITIALMSAF
jgi:Putative beta-barrel porin-2, OmpL-like. bbp2